MKRKILLAFALPQEVVDVELPGCEARTVLTGITKPYAAARLAKAVAEERPDLIINVGTAGTLHRSVGDIIVSTHFLDRDVQRQHFDSASGELHTSCSLVAALPSVVSGRRVTEGGFVVNTGDDFVTEAGELQADAIDMEAFADAMVAHEFGVEFVAVKYITDVVGRNSMEIWENKLADARAALREYFAACTF